MFVIMNSFKHAVRSPYWTAIGAYMNSQWEIFFQTSRDFTAAPQYENVTIEEISSIAKMRHKKPCTVCSNGGNHCCCNMNGFTPVYVADDGVPGSSMGSRRYLGFDEARKIVLRRTRTELGARDLARLGAVVWICLPATFRVSSLTVTVFAGHLETKASCLLTSASGDFYSVLYTCADYYY